MKDKSIIGALACLTAGVSWGAQFPIAGSASKLIDPFYFTLLRYLTGYAVRGRPHRCSSTVIGATSGRTSASRGTMTVCSSANCPDRTACGTMSVRTTQVEPAGNSQRCLGQLGLEGRRWPSGSDETPA